MAFAPIVKELFQISFIYLFFFTTIYVFLFPLPYFSLFFSPLSLSLSPLFFPFFSLPLFIVESIWLFLFSRGQLAWVSFVTVFCLSTATGNPYTVFTTISYFISSRFLFSKPLQSSTYPSSFISQQPHTSTCGFRFIPVSTQ